MLSLVAVSTLLLGANALTPSNIMRRTDGSLTGIKYTGVGGSGSYQEVTNMVAGTWPSCTANPSCEQSPKEVSGESRVCTFYNRLYAKEGHSAARGRGVARASFKPVK